MIAQTTDIAAVQATVLVVEDDTQLRELVSSTLRNAGFQVVEKETADDAIEYLKDPDRVSLVFADLRTPGKLHGIEFAQALKNNFPGVKIILTSGKVSRDDVPVGMLFLPKPYILARIIAEVRAMLGVEQRMQ